MLTPEMLAVALAIMLAFYGAKGIGHVSKKIGHTAKAAAVHVRHPRGRQ